jgi:hypothetical protein
MLVGATPLAPTIQVGMPYPVAHSTLSVPRFCCHRPSVQQLAPKSILYMPRGVSIYCRPAVPAFPRPAPATAHVIADVPPIVLR